MSHREQIEAIIKGENRRHEETLRTLSILLTLTDPVSGNVPSVALSAIDKLSDEQEGNPIVWKRREPHKFTLEGLISSFMKVRQIREEVTSRRLYELLIDQGYQGIAKDPDLAINLLSTALIKMTSKGLFRRTHLGKGREPSRYIWIGPVMSDDPEPQYPWDSPDWKAEEVPEETP